MNPRQELVFASEDWKDQPWHVLIVTDSGKPVYTFCGTPRGLVTPSGVVPILTATAQMIYRDSLIYVQSDDRIIALQRRANLLILVTAPSYTPLSAVQRVGSLAHHLLISTASTQLHAQLVRNTAYDPRRSFFGAMDGLVSAGILRATSLDIGACLGCPRIIPLTPSVRVPLTSLLTRFTSESLLASVLFSGPLVVAAASHKGTSVLHHADDIFALQCLVHHVLGQQQQQQGQGQGQVPQVPLPVASPAASLTTDHTEIPILGIEEEEIENSDETNSESDEPEVMPDLGDNLSLVTPATLPPPPPPPRTRPTRPPAPATTLVPIVMPHMHSTARLFAHVSVVYQCGAGGVPPMGALVLVQLLKRDGKPIAESAAETSKTISNAIFNDIAEESGNCGPIAAAAAAVTPPSHPGPLVQHWGARPQRLVQWFFTANYATQMPQSFSSVPPSPSFAARAVSLLQRAVSLLTPETSGLPAIDYNSANPSAILGTVNGETVVSPGKVVITTASEYFIVEMRRKLLTAIMFPSTLPQSRAEAASAWLRSEVRGEGQWLTIGQW